MKHSKLIASGMKLIGRSYNDEVLYNQHLNIGFTFILKNVFFVLSVVDDNIAFAYNHRPPLKEIQKKISIKI